MKRTASMIYKATEEATELFLYTVNDSRIYENMIVPVINNMTKKVKKGIFDANKAIDAFFHVATLGSKYYSRDYGYSFSVQDRFTAATDMVTYFLDDIQDMEGLKNDD